MNRRDHRRRTGRPDSGRTPASRALPTILLVLTAVGAAVSPSAEATAWAPATAQSAPATNEQNAGEETDRGDQSGDEELARRRENLATVLLMLLAGVCLVGVALIAGTMIWGAKLRRLARVPTAGCTQQDELWYLKRPPPSDDSPAAASPPTRDSSTPSADGEEGLP